MKRVYETHNHHDHHYNPHHDQDCQCEPPLAPGCECNPDAADPDSLCPLDERCTITIIMVVVMMVMVVVVCVLARPDCLVVAGRRCSAALQPAACQPHPSQAYNVETFN